VGGWVHGCVKVGTIECKFGSLANHKLEFRIYIKNCNYWKLEGELGKRSQFFSVGIKQLYAEIFIWWDFAGFERTRRTAEEKVRSQRYKNQTYNPNLKTIFVIYFFLCYAKQ
jgi:hypothetical protein